MKFKGKYAKDITEFTNCEILIEYGKLQRVKFNSRQLLNTSNPKDKSDFELEKISSDPVEFIPAKHNYVINYIGQNNEPRKIYLRLNLFQKVKFRFHRYYYSEKAKVFLTDIIKLMLGALLGVLGTLFVQYFSHERKDEPMTKPKNESQTVLANTNDHTSDKILKTDFIIDNKQIKNGWQHRI